MQIYKYDYVKIVMLLSNPYNPDDRVRSEAHALQEAGYEVFILAWDRDCNKTAREIVKGVEIRRARIPAGYRQGAKQGRNLVKLWRWFVRQIKEIEPQVVHCHDFDTFPAGAYYKIWNKQVRLVLDAHENYYVMKQPDVSSLFAQIIKLAEQFLTPMADLLISPCKATADHYRNLGADSSVIVGNWKDPDNYRFSSQKIQNKCTHLGIDNRLSVVYIGRLSKERIILPLVEAVRNSTSYFLILGGYGEQESEIAGICEDVDNIYFPGYINPKEVPLLTAIADVVYYGFDPNHPFAPYNAPNKLYEALAAGKAVLATDIGGELSEVVQSTGCGVLLSSPDAASIGAALNQLSQSGTLVKTQERAAEAGCAKYNWRAAKRNLLQAYSQLLS